MKNAKPALFLCIFVLLSFNAFSEQLASSSYKTNAVISDGGENLSSSSYKTIAAAGIINGITNSPSYISQLGFFHTLLLADNQPCTENSQCEGSYCCSSLCSSSACSSGTTPSGGGAASSGSSGGGGGGAAPAVAQEKKAYDFSMNPSSIKEHLALGNAISKRIKIKNTGTAKLEFSLDVATVSDMVFLSDKIFALNAGEEKEIELNMIGKKLGSYFGSIEITAGSLKKSVNIVIEVESEQVLFDAKLDIPSDYRQIKQGSELKTQITLLNVGPPRKVDVTTTYIIKDRMGTVVQEESETFAVEKQTSFVKSFTIPAGMKPGEYLVSLELRYGKSFAVSSELFEVVPGAQESTSRPIYKIALLSVLAASVLISLVILIISLRRQPIKRKKQ